MALHLRGCQARKDVGSGLSHRREDMRDWLRVKPRTEYARDQFAVGNLQQQKPVLALLAFLAVPFRASGSREIDIRPLPGRIWKQFTARDRFSRWDVLELRRNATARTAAGVLDALEARMPFPVAFSRPT